MIRNRIVISLTFVLVSFFAYAEASNAKSDCHDIYQEASKILSMDLKMAEKRSAALCSMAVKSNKKTCKALHLLLDAKISNEKQEYSKALINANKSESFCDHKTPGYLEEVFYEKAYAFYYTNSLDSSIHYLEELLMLNGITGNKELRGKYEILSALNHWHSEDFKGEIVHLESAIHIFEQLNDSLNLSIAHNSLGLIHRGLDNFQAALEACYKALSYLDTLSISRAHINQLVITYNNIGLIYNDWDNKSQAKDFFLKAKELIPTCSNRHAIANTYLNLGRANLNNRIYDEAISLLHQALETYSDINDLNGVSYSKLKIGHYYRLRDQYELANTWLRDALGDAQKIENKNNEIGALYQLAQNHYPKDIDQAKAFAFKALEIAESGGYKSRIRILYSFLSEVYVVAEEYKKAYEYQDRAWKMEDEVELSTIASQYELMKVTRQLDQQQQANKQLASQNRFLENLIKSGTTAIVVIAVLFIMVLVLFYRLAVRKKRLEQANNAKNRIFSIVSHDLRGPVGNLNNMVDLLLEEGAVENQTRMLKIFKPVITSTYNMLENLLVWSKSNLGRLEFSGSRIVLNELITGTYKQLIPVAARKSINIQFDPEEDLLVHADRIMLETILRNLVNNAIKFTGELGTIKITTAKKKQLAVISVYDNGIGIPAKSLSTMFNGEKHRLGTNNEGGSGLGLVISKELVEMNGGKIWVESTEGKGSSFHFTIPTAPS